MSQNHFVSITCNGQLIYDIQDVEQVPSIGHQLDLREAEVPVPGLYTVMDVTWNLAGRSVELDVELTEMPS